MRLGSLIVAIVGFVLLVGGSRLFGKEASKASDDFPSCYSDAIVEQQESVGPEGFEPSTDRFLYLDNALGISRDL